MKFPKPLKSSEIRQRVFKRSTQMAEPRLTFDPILLRETIYIFRKNLDIISDIVINFIKLGSLFSIVVGILLIIFYINRTSAPFPTNIISFVQILYICALVFLFFTMNFAIFIAIPNFMRYIFPPYIKHIFPNLFHDRENRRFSIYLTEYVTIYFPFLVFIALITLLNTHIYITYSLSCLFVGVIVYFNLKNDISLCQKIIFFAYIFIPNLSSIFWLAILYTISTKFLLHDKDHSLDNDIITVFLLVLFIVVHVVQNCTNKFAGLVALIIFIVVAWFPGFSYISMITLRFLGVGGGILANITVRELEKGKVVYRVKSGCIILNIGSELVFHNDPTSEDINKPEPCNITPSLLNPPSAPDKFSEVDVYQRTDVVEISKHLPSSQKTPVGRDDAIPK